MSSTLRLLGAALIVAAIAAPSADAAPKRVPQGFVGTMLDRVLDAPGFDMRREIGTMVRSGVETLRFSFQWDTAQPYASFDDVPPGEADRFRDVGGVPTDFSLGDRAVGAAARRGLAVLPSVVATPRWARLRPGFPTSPPADTATYAAYMSALVDRYGPRGTFWEENPSLPRRPVRSWQIWNEPNLRAFWSEQPKFGPSYVALLRDARRAIKREDPGARIVLAGLSNFSWVDLAQIYRQPGARRLFDQVAVHPYTKNPRGLVTILERVRRTMRRYGDARKSLVVTEFSFPASRGKVKGFGFETTRRGQARNVARALTLLARERRRLRIRAVYHYTWATADRPAESSFSYAGLRRLTGSGRTVAKPAFQTFRRTALRLERCRVKRVATRCERRARG